MWSQLKFMLPSVAIYFGLCLFLCFCAWFFLKRAYANSNFPIYLPVGFALLITLHFTGQNLIVYNASRTSSAANHAAVPSDPSDLQKMKADFLNTLNNWLGNPTQVTVQMKDDLFARYSNLFATSEAKKMFETNIGAVYTCQKAFYEDALESLKAKKVVKSDLRKRCYEMDGSFFGREKLVPAELVKANEDMVEKIAKGKPLKDGDKTSVANEKGLQEQISNYNVRVQTVKAMFN